VKMCVQISGEINLRNIRKFKFEKETVKITSEDFKLTEIST